MNSAQYCNVRKIEYHLPKDKDKYLNEFIVFFSHEENPKVLFHSINPEEAGKQADKIYHETKKVPTIIRVTNKESSY